jgi:chromosome segregation ATPase
MTIDERFEFIQRNIDSLHEAVFENTRHIAELTGRVDKLAETSERHEREINRFRKAMRAALEAWLSDNGDEPQENGAD